MRTRLSVRNQDRLFNYLFEPIEEKKEIKKKECCFNCINYPKHGRMRGKCSLKNKIVNGNDKKCNF